MGRAHVMRKLWVSVQGAHFAPLKSLFGLVLNTLLRIRLTKKYRALYVHLPSFTSRVQISKESSTKTILLKSTQAIDLIVV